MKISNLCATAVIVGCMSLGGSFEANAIGASAIVGKVAGKGEPIICRKAQTLKVSGRSGTGVLCGLSGTFGGFMIATCYDNNRDAFRKSGCYKKALGKLGLSGDEGAAAIKAAAAEKLAAGIKKAEGLIKPLACKNISSLPSFVQGIVKGPCAAEE